MDKEREEIVQWVIDTGLAEKCVSYRTNKCKVAYLKEELLQELYLWLCTYDIKKLKDAYDNNHMSALITRWIINNFYSKTSPFYKTFKKFDLSTDEFKAKDFEIPE